MGRSDRHQDQTATGQFGERKSTQTIMIQGNKQKMVTNDHEIVTDLDNNAVYMIDPAKKSYIQIPFPPKGPLGKMVQSAAGTMDFKKEAATRTILGYSCSDYSGSGQSMGGDYTVTECFSTSAPGATEFSTFQKSMAAKLKGMAPTGNIPDGIPLAGDSTVKMNTMKIPNLPPEQAQMFQQKIAAMKPVTTKTVVTKIESKTLPADTFSIPAGYTQRQLGMPPAMTAPAPAAAPSAAN